MKAHSHYSRAPREYTNRIIEALDEGLLDRDTVIMAALSYMSEDEVKDLAHVNAFFEDEDEDEDERDVQAPWPNAQWYDTSKELD